MSDDRIRPGVCSHYVRKHWRSGTLRDPIERWICEECGVTDIDVAWDDYWRIIKPTTHGEPSSLLGERRIPNMAGSQKTVYVPDRSTPMYFDAGLTTEEIKSALVSTGYTAVQNSEARISADGQTIRFERVTGGSKG